MDVLRTVIVTSLVVLAAVGGSAVGTTAGPTQGGDAAPSAVGGDGAVAADTDRANATGQGQSETTDDGTRANATAAPVEYVDAIVLYESRAARQAALAADAQGLSTAGATVTGGTDVDIVPMVTVRVPKAAMAQIEARPGVKAVERDVEVSTTGQTTPWGVDRINGTQAASAAGGPSAQASVDVAVLDTGVDPNHPDLNVTWGVNTTDGRDGTGQGATDPGEWNDTAGHGTEASGIVAAEDDGDGVVGVAPGVDLYAVKVLSDLQNGSLSDLIEGIDRAIEGPDGDADGNVRDDDGADVLSMSLGTPSNVSSFHLAIQEARAQGAVVVASAGNEGDGDPTTDEVTYPAKYDEVIAVAMSCKDATQYISGCDERDATATQSSEGPAVEVTAPGVLINTTARTSTSDGYRSDFFGTSAAAPHVSGIVALQLSRRPDATGTEVRNALRNTTLDIEDPGVDNFSGYGRVQARRAVEALAAPTVTVGAGTVSPDRAENGTTVTHEVQFAVANASADGADETVTLVVPSRGTVQSGSMTVTSGSATILTSGTNGNNVTADVASTGGGTVDYTLNATVEVAYPEAPGSTDEPFDVRVVDSSAGTDARTVATVRVFNNSTAFPNGVPGVGSTTPTDPDSDSLYEDVDGSGTFDFLDVVALLFADFEAINADPDQRAALNFDGANKVDFLDVVTLLFEL
jgi:subtilisin family serine protease